MRKDSVEKFVRNVQRSSFSFSAFPAMLDFQSGEQGKVNSLPQCLDRSPKLPMDIHRTGPCLASQSVKGGAGLHDVVGGLRTLMLGHSSEREIFSLWRWEELTLSSSQPVDCDGGCSVQLVDAVFCCATFKF